MMKNEQSNSINQSIRAIPSRPAVSLPQQPSPMLHTTAQMVPQRLIDHNAIDITSLKGQFAWEKIPQSDIYMPVIFRGDTKYFCVRMLRKLLPEYPEDVIRRSLHYQYRETIDSYHVTSREIELLNRINGNHSRWAYARQAFTALDEIIRVSDYLPFYEYLRQSLKSASLLLHTTNNTSKHSSPVVQRSSLHPGNISSSIHGSSPISTPTSIHKHPYLPSSDLSCENRSSTIRSMLSTSSVIRHSRPPKPIMNSLSVILPSQNIRPILLRPPPPIQQQHSISMLTNSDTNTIGTVPPNNIPTITNTLPVSLPPSTGNPSSTSPSVLSLQSASSPSSSSSASIINRKLSTSSSSASITKPSRLHCGWLQINKLYTPYVSASTTNHHEYKIPVSLLTFYDLLKNASPEMTNVNDSKDFLMPFAQTLVTSEEIEMINELCVKHGIKAFSNDTKLISLTTFYQYCSANIIFIKELPLNEPKASICKDWSSIVEINGGICRLRNIATLHEQTVPFIGNNLLKNFIISSQCLATASLTKPTAAELEFLQLILFFSNLSINLPNAQLINIESVQKEYNVDLILLFNDKFPLNVLNYQEQGNRSNVSQGAMIPSSSSAPTNTIAESTPPPSPPSPPNNQPQSKATSQLPLTSSTNRYHKTIQFHGHSMTAYICSGLGSNVQRECVSIKSLCNILCPDSVLLDKLEIKMLRLFRSKNVNRFRPQNQQSIGCTRLVDVRDAEKYWHFLEQGMRPMLTTTAQVNDPLITSTVSNERPKASALEQVENVPEPSADIPADKNKGEKRTLDEPLDEEDTPVMERLNKRTRYAEQVTVPSVSSLKSDKAMSNNHLQSTCLDEQLAEKRQTVKPPSTILKNQRTTPSNRLNKQSISTWVKKYNIEGCCIRLDPCDRIVKA